MKMLSFFLLFLLFLSNESDAKSLTIAFAQDTMANDFRKAQVFETQKALASYPNVTFVYSDAQTKTAMLIFQIDTFIHQKVDLIIIGTNDAKAITPSLEKAAQANIPVIILDRGVDSETYTTFINSDNIKIGQIGGEFIAQKLKGKGKVLLLEGLQTADVTHLRTKGFMDVMARFPEISVIQATANYLRRDAIIEVEKILAKGERFDAIFSESDSMVSGARSALQHHGIDPKSIISVGCDYTSEAQKEILAGNQTGSIKFPLAGKQAAEIAMQILDKVKVDKHIVIPVELVTHENAQKVEPIF